MAKSDSKAKHSKSNGTGARNPYKGIPAKDRKNVIALREVLRMSGEDITPKNTYLRLIAGRKEIAEKAKQDAEENQRQIREEALEALRPALDKLGEARDVAYAIEDDQEGARYFDHQSLGRFARLGIIEAGQELEQALCDLGLIPESDTGYFMDKRKRRGVAPVTFEKAQEPA